jgi:large subunit ribosomal protein L10
MNRSEKQKAVEDFQKSVEDSDVVFISDYKGLTALQMTELRMAVSKTGGRMKILKNRLATRAFDGNVQKEVTPLFDEMTAVTLVKGDIAASAKALTEFSKTYQAFKVKGGVLEGKVISLADVKALSDLPSREQLLAQLLAVWQAVPGGFVRVLNALPSGWVNVMDALKRKKEEEGSGS